MDQLISPGVAHSPLHEAEIDEEFLNLIEKKSNLSPFNCGHPAAGFELL